jgi:hypothetical protein
MFRAIPQPIDFSELLQIFAWRVMLSATRLLHRASARWAPVVLPVAPWLWVPMVALVFGTVLGFAIVR